MRQRIVALLIAAMLAAAAWSLPDLRRSLIAAIVTYDAEPSAPPTLPGGAGPGLSRAARTRVILIDGLTAAAAHRLPTWSSLCRTGATLVVDVGFPTVSLPVEVSLWTGRTQQQTGVVFRSGRPLVPPLDRRGIPAQIAGSHAVAEKYGYIVRSLGFARAEPAADPGNAGKDADPTTWAAAWQGRALDAVRSDASLVFVHVLRVDTAGHKHGLGPDYDRAAVEADGLVATLHAADPQARWFLLSDHGHLPGGGHGGEERAVREVQGCIVGPGIEATRGGPVHIVDVARALADSTGTTLDPRSPGRPLGAALASPLGRDQALPPAALMPIGLAIFILVGGLGLASWGVRRWWLAPWWFVVAVAGLLLTHGWPTLSTPMIYKPEGRDMYLTWLPALAVLAAATWFGLRRTTLLRALVAQLGLPLAAVAAAVTAAGAWPTLLGAELAPIVPRFTALLSPLLLMVAHAAAVVAAVVLAHVALRAFGRPSPPAPPQTAPASE